jgi:hypothetical protein
MAKRPRGPHMYGTRSLSSLQVSCIRLDQSDLPDEETLTRFLPWLVICPTYHPHNTRSIRQPHLNNLSCYMQLCTRAHTLNAERTIGQFAYLSDCLSATLNCRDQHTHLGRSTSPPQGFITDRRNKTPHPAGRRASAHLPDGEKMRQTGSSVSDWLSISITRLTSTSHPQTAHA